MNKHRIYCPEEFLHFLKEYNKLVREGKKPKFREFGKLKSIMVTEPVHHVVVDYDDAWSCFSTYFIKVVYREATNEVFEVLSEEFQEFIDYLYEAEMIMNYGDLVAAEEARGTVSTACTSLNDNSNACVKANWCDTSTSINSIINTDKIVSSTPWTIINDNIVGVTDGVTEANKRIDELAKTVDKLAKQAKTEPTKNNDEENKSMNKMFNFDFGKITSDAVRMSMYGIAIKSVNGNYVSYDAKTHSIMDVEAMNMPCGDLFYKMPVAIKDIKAGDVIIHNRVPMFVVEVHTSTVKVIDIHEGTEKEVYLTKSPFGFNFATKVVSMIDMTNVKADAANPFGSMLPFLMMKDGKMDDILPYMMMSGNTMNMSNPMMMYLMMKDGKSNDMLPLMLMMNQTQSQPKCECNCHQEG